MKKLIEIFKKLTPADHFTVFLLILTTIKIIHTYNYGMEGETLRLLGLSVGLLAISSLIFFGFKFLFDPKKRWQNAMISTLLLLLLLEHTNPDLVTGLSMLFLLYISKFFIKSGKKSIFNPVAFAIVGITLLSFILPFVNQPDLSWGGINITFAMFGTDFPLPIIPIFLSIFFNVGRIKRHPLVLSFVLTAVPVWLLLLSAPNVSLIVLSVLFLGGAILIEPQTAPIKFKEQIGMGIAAGLLLVGLVWTGLPNAEMFVICFANMGYFGYKKWKFANPKKINTSSNQIKFSN